MSIKWVFPPSNGGTYKGFNDSSIETFTGARYDSLAREIIQNSLDAAASSDTKITVEFGFILIDRSEFPGADELLKVMEQCLEEQESQDDVSNKATAFFKRAVGILKEPMIPCLKISDFGTTGLRGDYRKGQWHAMTKAEGVSAKKDSTSGGSYGIGKNAPFTVSNLRTVFYSTLYKDDNGREVTRTQGKSILVSHKIGNGEDYTQATGFYGKEEGCLPIDPIDSNVPEFLHPGEQGCVILIPGFDTETDWSKKIMVTVVSNFFCAIEQGKLDVLIEDEGGKVESIEKETLDKCFEEIKNLGATHNKETNSYHYYQVMKSENECDCRTKEFQHLGHCKIWLQVREGLPKRVALIRKTGMLITDDQKGLKRWTGCADFAGVFICKSDKGNELLRSMENPQHNAFEPERVIHEQRKVAKKALKELVDWVDESVKELAKPEETSTSPIDELSEFFPDRDIDETISGDEGEKDIESYPVYEPYDPGAPRPLPPRPEPSEEDDDGEEGGAGGTDGTGGDGNGRGLGEGSGIDGTGNRRARQIVEIKNVRIVSDTNDNKKKKVFFTPAKSGNVEIILSVMGDDGRADNIPFSGDKMISIKENERSVIDITLDYPVSDSIALNAFHQKGGAQQ